MKGYLVRVGVDQAFGGWNAPVDPISGEFVYVPIPESAADFQPSCRRELAEFRPALELFCRKHSLGGLRNIGCDTVNFQDAVHLDPDFEHLTYGDDSARRGAGVASLDEGDVVAFYSGLRPVKHCEKKLIYAIVGLYIVHEVVKVTSIEPPRWHENAHSRKKNHWPTDVILRGMAGRSGRLERCIDIGEWREGAYRVKSDLLLAWGGLSVKNGFIQRSAVPPKFTRPDKFYEWFKQQQCTFLRGNY